VTGTPRLVSLLVVLSVSLSGSAAGDADAEKPGIALIDVAFQQLGVDFGLRSRPIELLLLELGVIVPVAGEVYDDNASGTDLGMIFGVAVIPPFLY